MARGKRKDEEGFGTGDKARDGEPIEPDGGTAEGGMSAEDDELARRRAERKNGDALADKDVEDGDEEQGELFPVGSLEGDPKVTLAKLVRAGHRIEYTASLMSAEVPLQGGLLDPNDEGQVMVTYEVASLTPVPIREGDRGTKKLVGWKIRQNLRPVYVEPIEAAKPGSAAAG